MKSRMFVIKTISIFLFLMLLNTFLLAAEKNEQFIRLAPKDLWWIYGGGGYGRISNHMMNGQNTTGWNGLLECSYNTNIGLISLRHLGSDQEGKGINSVKEIGILYGILGKQNNQLLSLSLGISRIYGYYKYDKVMVDFYGLFMYTEYKHREDFTTIGIPIELQTIGTFESFPYVGFGASIYANWNNKMPYYGASFNIYFGKMGIREKRENYSDSTL